MADGIHIKIDGAQELTQALKALDRSVARKLIRTAFKRAGALILDKAKINAPVDTGALKDSLIAKVSFRKGMVKVDIITKGAKDKETLNQGDQFYAAFVELGTSKQPPRPFLRPALKDSESQVKNLIIESLREGIAEVLK